MLFDDNALILAMFLMHIFKFVFLLAAIIFPVYIIARLFGKV